MLLYRHPECLGRWVHWADGFTGQMWVHAEEGSRNLQPQPAGYATENGYATTNSVPMR